MIETKRIERSRLRKALIVAGVLVAILALLCFLRDSPLFNAVLDGNIQKVRSLLKGNMLYAYLFMLLIMIIQNSFTVIPLILVITINLTLFGFWQGFLWSWFTSVVAAYIICVSVRYIFKNRVIKRFNPAHIEKMEKNGFKYVFQARVFPFVPTSLINILAGLSTIRYKSFLLATAIGNFVYFFVLALIPAGLLSADINLYVLAILVMFAFGIYYVIKRIYLGHKNQILVKIKKIRDSF
ncbi:MAG: TVP38/TMEM64 family protein [Bacillus sp. (in: firmicutes)]